LLFNVEQYISFFYKLKQLIRFFWRSLVVYIGKATYMLYMVAGLKDKKVITINLFRNFSVSSVLNIKAVGISM